MAWLDLIVVVVVLLFVVHGYFRGLLRKLAGIAALVIASLGVGFVAGEAAQYLQERMQVSSPWIHVGCAVVGWIVLYTLLRLILGLIARVVLSALGKEVKSWDRKLGAVFGGLQAVVLCWFVVLIADAFPADKRAQYVPPVHRELQRSVFADVVHQTSPAAWLELQPLMADLTTVCEHPESLRTLGKRKEVLELLRNEKVRSALTDEEVIGHWMAGRHGRALSNRKAADALQDPEVRGLLRDLPIRDILRQAAEEASQEGRAGPTG